VSQGVIIDKERTVGYNNKLKQAISGMKLGVNNAVNPGTKKGPPQTNGRRAIKN